MIRRVQTESLTVFFPEYSPPQDDCDDLGELLFELGGRPEQQSPDNYMVRALVPVHIERNKQRVIRRPRHT
jgi:hypothetical protein